VIEDTRRIRFFEFADDIIKQDVFVADKDLSVLVRKNRGRPENIEISLPIHQYLRENVEDQKQ